MRRGAVVLADGGVRFSVWAPRCARVEVRYGPDSRVRDLVPAPGGVFEIEVEDATHGTDYLFRLDGAEWLPDPASRHQAAGVSGPSRVLDPRQLDPRDDSWRGLPRAELVFYELHVGTFTPHGTFEGIIELLPALAELGITAIELMPVAEFPGRRNWGYDGVFPHAPHHAYGGPRGLRRLVDAAHRAGLAVILDVVYNHLGPEGNVFHRYAPYFTDRYRTPWGQGINFDGPGSDEVRALFVDNALQWLHDYGIDGLRLDAVHAILDNSAQPFLAELVQAVRSLERRLGRQLHLIAESDANDPQLLRAPGQGGCGLDASWNDDFHHAVHALLSGERDGYYCDFGRAGDVVDAWAHRFVYRSRYSTYRGRRHGAPADDLASDRFVVYAQNHDQIGNRAGGERLASLTDHRRARLAAALVLLSPCLPLLFMGEEYGETRPFLYFVDHADPALLAAVREGRRQEFADFGWHGDVPDPGDPATFEASRPDPSLARQAEHAAVLRLYRALLAARREHPALRPGVATEQVHRPADGSGVFASTRRGEIAATLAVVFNLDPESHELMIRDIDETLTTVLLHTEQPEFGGDGLRQVSLSNGRLHLPPLSACLVGGRHG